MPASLSCMSSTLSRMRGMEGYLKCVQEAGLEGAIAIVHGLPHAEILQTVKAKNIDLIVIGTHG